MYCVREVIYFAHAMLKSSISQMQPKHEKASNTHSIGKYFFIIIRKICFGNRIKSVFKSSILMQHKQTRWIYLLMYFFIGAVATRLPPDVSEHLDEYWYMYKMTHNKTYTGRVEERRRAAWEENLLKIYEHNLLAAAGHYEYSLRDNHISDLDTPQYIREWVKLVPSRRRRLMDDEMVAAVLTDPKKIPRSLDWREKGFVTYPENQRDCGSCYAYSIAGSVSGQIFRETGMVVSLSEQQLVDCSTQTGNIGCSGGSLRNTLRYLEKSKGLMTDATYPYTAKQGTCKYQKNLGVVNITAWAILPARDERALEAAVATIGPVAASINASPKTFQLYSSGIYDDPSCSSNIVNHAMLIIGYTTNEWILKNWWGADWGENGYMRLRKGKNRCGVANYAAYVKI